MVLELIVLDLRLFNCSSLKDKRSQIKSVVERIRRKFNVSIVESGFQDNINFSEISIALIASDKASTDMITDHIINFFGNNIEGEVKKINKDYF